MLNTHTGSAFRLEHATEPAQLDQQRDRADKVVSNEQRECYVREFAAALFKAQIVGGDLNILTDVITEAAKEFDVVADLIQSCASPSRLADTPAGQPAHGVFYFGWLRLAAITLSRWLTENWRANGMNALIPKFKQSPGDVLVAVLDRLKARSGCKTETRFAVWLKYQDQRLPVVRSIRRWRRGKSLPFGKEGDRNSVSAQALLEVIERTLGIEAVRQYRWDCAMAALHERLDGVIGPKEMDQLWRLWGEFVQGLERYFDPAVSKPPTQPWSGCLFDATATLETLHTPNGLGWLADVLAVAGGLPTLLFRLGAWTRMASIAVTTTPLLSLFRETFAEAETRHPGAIDRSPAMQAMFAVAPEKKFVLAEVLRDEGRTPINELVGRVVHQLAGTPKYAAASDEEQLTRLIVGWAAAARAAEMAGAAPLAQVAHAKAKAEMGVGILLAAGLKKQLASFVKSADELAAGAYLLSASGRHMAWVMIAAARSESGNKLGAADAVSNAIAAVENLSPGHYAASKFPDLQTPAESANWHRKRMITLLGLPDESR